jgi:hypothetical protein
MNNLVVIIQVNNIMDKEYVDRLVTFKYIEHYRERKYYISIFGQGDNLYICLEDLVKVFYTDNEVKYATEILIGNHSTLMLKLKDLAKSIDDKIRIHDWETDVIYVKYTILPRILNYSCNKKAAAFHNFIYSKVQFLTRKSSTNIESSSN